MTVNQSPMLIGDGVHGSDVPEKPMTRFMHNSDLRKWFQYGLICWLLLIGAVGPLLQTLDDDENLGLHAFSEPGLTIRVNVKAAHTPPGVLFVGPQTPVLHGLRAFRELAIAEPPRAPEHVPVALLFFPLRP